MSIQSSLNQLLGTATIGAGLYTQSPIGKEQTELRQLRHQYRTAERSFNEATEAITPEASLSEEAIQRRADVLAKTSGRISELKPTAKNLAQAASDERLAQELRGNDALSCQEIAEKKAFNSQLIIQQQQNDQKTSLTERKNWLKELQEQGIISKRQYKHIQYETEKRGGNS